MKKYLILTSVLALTACGSAYHTGKIGIQQSNPVLEYAPKEAKISIDTNNKLTGTAECSSLLWIFNVTPERQTYGITIHGNEGNFAPSNCVAAAVYDAMKSSDADTMYGLNYTATKKGVLCIMDRCLIGNTKIIVKGYPAKITSIADKDRPATKDKK